MKFQNVKTIYINLRAVVRELNEQPSYVTSSTKKDLTAEQISKALINRASWAASDQGLQYLSLMSIERKHFSRSLRSFDIEKV